MGTSFDAWYPGYVDYAPIFKNIPAFWTETAGNSARRPASTRSRTSRRPSATCGRRACTRARGRAGWWRLGDAVDYNETAAIATLEYAAKYKDVAAAQPLPGGPRSDRARPQGAAPFAYVVPQQQRDPVAAVEMLRRLAFGGVRVSQLTAAATFDGVSYPAGTWVVPTDQEFARDRARGARRPEVSRPAAVPRRSAAAPVRRRRLDAAAADGRPDHRRRCRRWTRRRGRR